MELRAKELESKLEFEQTTRARLEVQITRLKEATDKLQTDLAHARTKEAQAQDNLRKLQRSLRFVINFTRKESFVKTSNFILNLTESYVKNIQR